MLKSIVVKREDGRHVMPCPDEVDLLTLYLLVAMQVHRKSEAKRDKGENKVKGGGGPCSGCPYVEKHDQYREG